MTRQFQVVALLTALAAPALAGQVANDTARTGAKSPYGAKGDGVYYGRASSYQNETLFAEDGSLGAAPASFYMDFTTQGDDKEIICLQDDHTAYDTTTLLLNQCWTSLGFTFNVLNIGVQTTPPDMDASSLDIGGVQTDDIGMDLSTGTAGASGRPFVVGRDGAFFTCATVAFEEVSGSDDFHVGFREIQVPTATLANYVDYAAVGFNGNADPQLLEIEQDVGTSETIYDMSATLASATTAKLCLFVSSAGVVTGSVDGGTPVSGGTFTDGTVVVPWIYTIHDASVVGELDLTYWEAGFGDSTKQVD